MGGNLRYGLIGSGSWATAIAKMVLTNEEHLNWWVRREETRDHLRSYGRNPNYIQSIAFETDKLHVSIQMQEVIDASDVLIFAIPSISGMFVRSDVSFCLCPPQAHACMFTKRTPALCARILYSGNSHKYEFVGFSMVNPMRSFIARAATRAQNS